MPDLFCHAATGYMVLRPRWRFFFIPPVFLLGCIFPDLIRGPLLMLTNYVEIPRCYTTPFLILHSPVPLFFQAVLFSQFFEEKIRGKIFKNLMAGIGLHLLLDMGQRAYHVSYLFFYPFSFKNPVSGLWWADEGIYLTILFSILAAALYFFRKRDELKNSRQQKKAPRRFYPQTESDIHG